MKKIVLISFFVFLLLGGGAFYYYFSKKTEFISPLGIGKILSSTTALPKNSEVIGFLPYWNLKNEPQIDFSVLDQLIYFGLAVGDDGDFVKTTDDSYEEPGWTWFKSDSLNEIKNLAHKNDKKVLFSINAFNNELIDLVLSNYWVQEKLISNTASLVKEYNFDGVNVDFEYVYNEDGNYPQKENYTKFIERLGKKLKNDNRNAILSADFYANAIIHDTVYDVSEVSKYLDNVIIMAYDFHRPGSSYSGPVAPLKSSKGRSIIEAVQASFDKVGIKKVILGIPLYGYEWQTYSDEPGSLAIPRTGALASYKRVHQLIEDEKLETKWDSEAMSPYLVFKDNGSIKQIYYENLESLSLKYQLVKQMQLGGVAFWAIGYEGEFDEVWQEVGNKLKN